MIFYKRSQAALEFLTTYGWAFLVILVMIGAMAYFGILNPTKLLPDRCNFGSEIGCDKDRMLVKNEAENTLTMSLKNNFGTAVVLTGASITSDNAVIGTCDPQSPDEDSLNSGTTSWSAGDLITLYADCTGGASLVEGDKIRMNIEINYYAASAGSDYTKTIYGEVVTKVE